MNIEGIYSSVQKASIFRNLEQGTPEWDEWRADGIGATDAAAIFGVSKWDTPLSIYAKKTYAADKVKRTAYQEWGTALEPTLVAKILAEHPDWESGRCTTGQCYALDWMKCSLDAEIHWVDKGIIIECKTGRTASDWDPVPEGYFAQVQWQMLVTKMRVAYFSVLINGWDWFERTVEFDEEYAVCMYEKCSQFYNDWQQRIAPTEIINPQRDYNALVDLHRITESSAEISEHDYKRLIVAKDMLEKAQFGYDHITAELAQKLVDNKRLTFDNRTVAQYVERKAADTFDRKAFRTDHPDIYDKYSRQSGIVRYIKFL